MKRKWKCSTYIYFGHWSLCITASDVHVLGFKTKREAEEYRRVIQDALNAYEKQKEG